MAFNVLDYLKEGKIDFIYNLTEYDINNLVRTIRNSKEKDLIIDGFLRKALKHYSRFCFKIIYDNDKYESETKFLLSKNKGFYFNDEEIVNVLNNTNWGRTYLLEHIDFYLTKLSEETIIKIFDCVFAHYNDYKDYIDYFKIHKNLHIRFLFMNYIVNLKPELLMIIYPNFIDYLTSYTHQEYEQLTFLPELMDSEDISKLAFSILKSKLDKSFFYSLKEYILVNYPKNDLAKELLELRRHELSNHCYTLVCDEEGIEEFKKDADRLFETSKSYQFSIYNNFYNCVSKELIDSFTNIISVFRHEDLMRVSTIYSNGIGDLLKKYIDKYLSLSQDKSYEYIGRGSTSCVYRFGDYVIKLFSTKWSYEDVICPNIYLIVKNLEECYIRDRRNIVCAGLEVQKFLKRDATNIPLYIWKHYREEFSNLGYKCTDTFMGGVCGDNCRILDSYKDADCNNPERLPDWFKEYPVVLIDRDRVYDKSLNYIKQLSERIS